jgi:hypothetical protein
MVQVRPVADHDDPAINPTTAVWLVALAALMVKVRLVRVVATPGEYGLAVDVVDPPEATFIE